MTAKYTEINFFTIMNVVYNDFYNATHYSCIYQYCHN